MKTNYEFKLSQNASSNQNSVNSKNPPTIVDANQNQQNMLYSPQNMSNNNCQYQQVRNPNQLNGTQNMGYTKANNGWMNPNGNANGALSN